MSNTEDQFEDREDESGLEKENEDTAEIEVPFDPSKIDIQVKTLSISALQSRLKNGELDLTPDFQRQANVWDTKRKSRLIESVLLRIPLPSFYLSEDEDGSYAVVDGLQRLCSLFHFINHEELNKSTGANLSQLQLQQMQYLKDLNGATFEKLDRKFQRRINELEITANIIRASTPPEVKFNVFARLNQGGMPLNAQEIRNAIYSKGMWRGKIQELAASNDFIRITEGKIKTQRQQDIELILRFIALWNIGQPFHRPTNQTLDEFLNDTVDKFIYSWSERDWHNAETAFHKGLKAAHLIFGKHVFRKSIGSINRLAINRSLFESQVIVLSVMSDDEISRLIERKDFVSNALRNELQSGKSLASALLYGTGSPEASNTRIKELKKIFDRVVHD